MGSRGSEMLVSQVVLRLGQISQRLVTSDRKSGLKQLSMRNELEIGGGKGDTVG